jgi:hypothetical protein
MQRVAFTTIVLLLLGMTTRPNFAQVVPPQLASDSNAALQYWLAFSQLPDLNDEQEQLLEHWDTAALDDTALHLLEASRTSLMYLHRGAALPLCNWGLDYRDGPKLLLPHLAKARTLARLAALHGRHEFEEGRAESGLADAIAMLALARHVERDPIMVSLLVGYSIESAGIDLVAPHLTDSKLFLPDFSREIEALPPAATVRQTILTEKEFMAKWLLGALEEADQTKRAPWRELWREMLVDTEAPEFVTQVKSRDQAMTWLKDLLPVYDELALRLDQPAVEFDAQYVQYAEATKRQLPLASVLLPPVDKILAKERRVQTQRALLLAAIAVIREGPEKLRDIEDPQGPFEYRALSQGFELVSKLQFDGQPVTLQVGAP